MMLMTFHENAVVPSKLTTFYDSAFQTLLTWHDATKDSFERERTLSVDKFRRVFSTFCLLSYCDQSFEFSEQALTTLIQRSLKYHGYEADPVDVQHDICESANLIQRDGLVFSFVHRSFQEYFAAECAMRVVSGKAEELLKIFAKRERDSVFFMCYEIHPELVYDKYLCEHSDSLMKSGFLDSTHKKSIGFCSDFVSALTAELVTEANKQISTRVFIPTQTKNDKEARFMELCNDLSENKFGMEPVFSVLQAVFLACDDSLEGKMLSHQAKLLLEIQFEPNNFKISVRNHGEEKASRKEINEIKGLLRDSLDKRLTNAGKSIRSYKAAVRNFLIDQKSQRESKERSILEILGI